MKGSYKVEVANANLKYEFVIRRNITIIKGDSATGKTTLVEMIRDYYEDGEKSGIELICERPCRAVGGRDWHLILSVLHETIVFIDENNEFLPTVEFARAVRDSDNYYVLVTREGLPNLPYSVEEIYGIRNSGKYGSLKKIYHEFYHIYGKNSYSRPLKPEVLLLEDSNAGFEFFQNLAQLGECTAVSAGGKSNIFLKSMENSKKRLLIIADGAAFGAEMDRVMQFILEHDNITLYLPESFEWLILTSGVIVLTLEERKMLSVPEEYIESKKYFSWERFFTEFLVATTNGTYLQYAKNRLNPNYLHKAICDKIRLAMPELGL